MKKQQVMLLQSTKHMSSSTGKSTLATVHRDGWATTYAGRPCMNAVLSAVRVRDVDSLRMLKGRRQVLIALCTKSPRDA